MKTAAAGNISNRILLGCRRAGIRRGCRPKGHLRLQHMHALSNQSNYHMSYEVVIMGTPGHSTSSSIRAVRPRSCDTQDRRYLFLLKSCYPAFVTQELGLCRAGGAVPRAAASSARQGGAADAGEGGSDPSEQVGTAG